MGKENEKQKGNLYAEMPLEIARVIGEPINYQKRVPVELEAIADVIELQPGEFAYRYSAVDTDPDYVMAVAAGGAITPIEKEVVATTGVVPTGLQSRLEWVEVNDILGSPDLQILARKKEAITRGMDKHEIFTILTGIIASTSTPGVSVQSVSAPSGTSKDIYDLIIEAKHKVEDYGDSFVLLAGSTVKEKIDTYDKDKAGSFNYSVTLSAKLRELGIDVIKIFGQYSYAGADRALLDTNTFILLAKNSRYLEGKPVKFVRRIISADIANLMGADVDSAQRALIVNNTPVIDTSNRLAFGVYGYEQITFLVPNPKVICFCDAENAL